MLDEILTDEERAVVARARAFAEAHVAPNAARWEWERRFPLETLQAACAAGLNRIELATAHTNLRAQAVYDRSGYVIDEVYRHYERPIV